ncbi:putative nucleoid protein H-NS [Burkholderia pseudomallei MSHR5596]|nr:putative nucleoid protein H-NS [Burkholderia pseudomallei MSHR5596]
MEWPRQGTALDRGREEPQPVFDRAVSGWRD